MKYLGVDYGLKKIGLAVSDGQIASVYKVVETNGLQDSLQKVKKIIEDEEVEQIVIGFPEGGEARKITENFAERLAKEVTVIRVDETLSSQDAKKLMVDMGLSKKSREKEDAYSAALILQGFLDSLN